MDNLHAYQAPLQHNQSVFKVQLRDACEMQQLVAIAAVSVFCSNFHRWYPRTAAKLAALQLLAVAPQHVLNDK